MKKILMMGFKSSGKTTLGKRLAHHYGLPFYDSDALLLKKFSSRSIFDLFNQLGESNFRLEEHLILNSFLTLDCAVFSIGGGSLEWEKPSEWFDHFTIRIFLDIELEEVKNRLGHYVYFHQIDQKYGVRKPQFEARSNLTISVKKTSIDDLASSIISQIDRDFP